MGEAKRRNAQAKQVGAALRQRVAAGEFGPPGQAGDWICVIDKSAVGRELLATLRATDALAGLAPLLEDEAFRFWEASALFRFVVLCGGEGRPAERVAVAADRERLLGETLPRLRRRFAVAGRPLGTVLGVAEEDREAVRQALDGAVA